MQPTSSRHYPPKFVPFPRDMFSSTVTEILPKILFLPTEYREAFKCFDLNENGTLSTKELKYAMRMLGSNPTDSQVQDLVNAKDFDGKKYACVALILVPRPARFLCILPIFFLLQV